MTGSLSGYVCVCAGPSTRRLGTTLVSRHVHILHPCVHWKSHSKVESIQKIYRVRNNYTSSEVERRETPSTPAAKYCRLQMYANYYYFIDTYSCWWSLIFHQLQEIAWYLLSASVCGVCLFFFSTSPNCWWEWVSEQPKASAIFFFIQMKWTLSIDHMQIAAGQRHIAIRAHQMWSRCRQLKRKTRTNQNSTISHFRPNIRQSHNYLQLKVIFIVISRNWCFIGVSQEPNEPREKEGERVKKKILYLFHFRAQTCASEWNVKHPNNCLRKQTRTLTSNYSKLNGE